MPPACPTERVFLVISVLLCHFEEGTKEARTREISRIRASDQLFLWGLREKLSEVPVFVRRRGFLQFSCVQAPFVPAACHSHL